MMGVKPVRLGTWKELTKVDRPKICAVTFIGVSLSNIPCVSINKRAIFSPFESRINGSDQIHTPVVCRSLPPLQTKLLFKEGGVATFGGVQVPDFSSTVGTCSQSSTTLVLCALSGWRTGSGCTRTSPNNRNCESFAIPNSKKILAFSLYPC